MTPLAWATVGAAVLAVIGVIQLLSATSKHAPTDAHHGPWKTPQTDSRTAPAEWAPVLVWGQRIEHAHRSPSGPDAAYVRSDLVALRRRALGEDLTVPDRRPSYSDLEYHQQLTQIEAALGLVPAPMPQRPLSRWRRLGQWLKQRFTTSAERSQSPIPTPDQPGPRTVT